MGKELKIQIPEKLGAVFSEKATYRVAYGGRASGKSWTFAQMLVVEAIKSKKLILCARELQKSIRDSSHRLIADTIERLGLQSQFSVGESFIRHKNGTEFIFKGLRFNADEIKSTEGIDIVWIEEAHRITKKSLQLLLPTIRKEGSEIWITFNPDDEDDEVYQRFVINEPPENSRVAEINYHDNPWFSNESDEQRKYDQVNNPDEYEHIWEGKIRKAGEGSYFARALADLREGGNITEIPYNSEFLVDTYWDIGMSDYTTIWFVQKIGYRYHLIDYVQANGEELQYYANEIRGRKYNYRTHHLPHDAGHLRLGMGGRTVLEQLQALLPDSHELDKLPPSRDINSDIMAVRAFIKRCAFDKEKCHDGLKHLKRYRKRWNEQKNKFEDKPYHDEHSHAADAFRYFAIHCAEDRDMAYEFDYDDLGNTDIRVEVVNNDFTIDDYI
ncbi:MAG: PBSX family phage terminase large subunit [Pseudomonadales bacterium]|nr:PBSX family phage terminase large subunit [Pseudomonadales bacterium]